MLMVIAISVSCAGRRRSRSDIRVNVGVGAVEEEEGRGGAVVVARRWRAGVVVLSIVGVNDCGGFLPFLREYYKRK